MLASARYSASGHASGACPSKPHLEPQYPLFILQRQTNVFSATRTRVYTLD